MAHIFAQVLFDLTAHNLAKTRSILVYLRHGDL
jgi:hypothetical protein